MKINLRDTYQIREYLIYNLSNNIFRKSKTFFRKIITLYNIYPKLIKDILDNLDKFTYFKNYLKILSLSKNSDLNDYIFQLLLKKLKQDIINNNNNLKISTLAKWLPRKGSHYDKKINFVNKFIKILFPNEKNKLKSFILYKKTITKLTKVINPIEINLSSKQYDNIKYLTNKNKNIYINKIHNDIKNLEEVIYNDIKKLSYEKLISRILWLSNLKNKKKEFFENEKKYIDEYYKNNFLNLFKDIFEKEYFILDISSRMIENNKNEIFRLSLYYLYKNKKIIINSNSPILIIIKDNIFENIESINNSLSFSKAIDLIKISNMFKSNNYLIFSEKNIENVIKNDQNYIYIKHDKNEIKKINENYYIGDIFYEKKINPKLLLIESIFDNHEEFKNKNIFLKIIGFVILIFLSLICFFKY